jgi:TonB-linked SusC/RagA family outer membrane protein
MAYNEKAGWVSEHTLNYKKSIRKHAIDALAGISFQAEDVVYTYLRMQQLPYEQLEMSGIDQGDLYSTSTWRNDWTLMSGFARFNYNYNWKYYLTATIRADGSSKFAPGNRWGYFPSASLMWRLSKEKFMKELHFITDAKLRTSWGLTGNNRVSEYASLSQITADKINKYYFGDTPYNSTAKTVMGNPDLKWETTMQTDIGLDLKLFDNRISFTTDLYLKRTKDLLLNAQLPGSFGYPSSYKNIGEVENRGLEFTLNTVNIKKKDFSWETNFNIAFNRNRVLGLTENQKTLPQSVWWNWNWDSQIAYITRVGEPVGQIYGFVYEGTYKYDEFIQSGSAYYLKDNIAYPGTRANVRPGDMKYKDINDDGIINDNDRTIIGRGTPIHTGGFTNVFRYGNLDLSVFFQWSYGNDIMNANKYMFERYDRPNSNMYAAYAGRWTPDNPNSDIPRVSEGSGGNYSSYAVEDGSYLRLKTVTLGYNLPKKIADKLSLQNVRVFVSGQNLWTWTNYSGMDPEVSTRKGALTPGFDFSAYPRAKTFTVGLNMSLK